MAKCVLCRCSYKKNRVNQKYCGSYILKKGCSYIMYLNPKKSIKQKKIPKDFVPKKKRIYTERSILYNKLYRMKVDLTVEEYKEMVRVQNNLCAICKKSQIKKSLAIDHNHKTKKVRGLLCSKCNIGLGQFNDDIEILSKAVEYLKNYQ